MSHPYIAVDSLGHQLLKKGFSQELVYLLKDLIRLGDSTGLINLRRINKKFQLSLDISTHQTASESFTQALISNAENYPLSQIQRVLLAEKDDRRLIDYHDRRYDEILGPVFDHRLFRDSFDLLLQTKELKAKKIAFFTTCASVKPYPVSPTFSRVFDYIDEQLGKEVRSASVHWLVLSNASAPIPEEFHSTFPYYAYETDLNRLSKKQIQKYKEVTTDQITRFLEKFHYDHYIALLRPNHMQQEVLEAATANLNIDVDYYPKNSTIRRIKSLGPGFWSRRGLTHELTLKELTNKLASAL
jgi:hypothetical protein